MSTDQKRDRNDPSNRSAAYDFMAPKWAMIETLLGGTCAMRDAGQAYLPQHPAESNPNYVGRLASTTLFNMMEITLNSLVGKPFSKPIEYGEDTPEEIKAIAQDDIDFQGNDLGVFARRWFREGLAKSYAHVLVDMPALDEDEKNTRTLDDDNKEKRRPYWVLIKPENVLSMYSVNINGVETLEQVCIYECETVMDGFAESFQEYIRVLRPGSWTRYEKQKSKGRKIQWVARDSGTTGLDFIPLVTFYTDKQAQMVGKPPLEDLAYLNVRHWQSTSDQINVLTVARFPMLAVSGAVISDTSHMAIGPRQLLATKNENGKYYYVEHEGAAIEAGKQDLTELEQQMASYGAEFLKKRPGGMTATARALDSAEATSQLQDYTVQFMDAVALAMNYTAAWMGLDKENGGTIKLVTDFASEESKETDLGALAEARTAKDISRSTYVRELRRRRVLSQEFDEAADLQALKDEPTFNQPPPPADGIKPGQQKPAPNGGGGDG